MQMNVDFASKLEDITLFFLLSTSVVLKVEFQGQTINGDNTQAVYRKTSSLKQRTQETAWYQNS